MNNTIIELKEKSIDNSQSLNYLSQNTGDYSCQVGEITLFKGDQLSIRSAFIDQVGESSDLIEVLPDEIGNDTATLTLTYGYYIQDWGDTPSDAILSPDGTVTTAEGTSNTRFTGFFPANDRVGQDVDGVTYTAGQPNGQIYFGSNVLFHPTAADKAKLCLLTGFGIGVQSGKDSKSSRQKNIRVGYFKYEDVKSTDEARIFHYLTIVFKKNSPLDEHHSSKPFLDINNDTVGEYVRFGKNDHVGGGPATSSGLLFPIAMRNNSFTTNTSPKDTATTRKDGTYEHFSRMIQDDHLVLGALQQSVMTAGGTYSPSTFTQSVTIPAKSYDPEDLALMISSAFSNVDPNPLPNHEIKKNFVSSNKLITTTDNFNTNFADNPFINNVVPGYGNVALAPNVQENIFGNYVADDGYQIVQISTVEGNKQNQFLGTTNFDIHFDGSRFLVNQMHTPIFDNNGNNIVKSLQCAQTKAGAVTVSRRFANKSSGIYLTDLQPNYLWFNRMKFDPSILTMTGGTNTITVNNIPGPGTVDCVVPMMEFTDGRNITGDIVSIGSVQPPPSNNEGVLWSDAIDFNNRKMIESQNIPILADLYNSNDNTKEKNGYYQLEIDCGINSTDIMGQDQKNNKIKAIISKFYTDKSYLSTYNEGAIPYIHTSDVPITLSTFKVRILDSKGVLASINNQLGDDNTVFMEIIRGQK